MKKIILIAGDPNSINSEIIYKTWKKINNREKKQLYIIGNFILIKKQFKRLKYNIQITKLVNLQKTVSSNKLKIINIPLNFKDPFNVSLNSARKYIRKSFQMAHKFCLKKCKRTNKLSYR